MWLIVCFSVKSLQTTSIDGERRYRPQTTSATAYAVSATSNILSAMLQKARCSVVIWLSYALTARSPTGLFIVVSYKAKKNFKTNFTSVSHDLTISVLL